EKHRFLEENALSDRQVGRVVDLLARTPEGRFVDYRDLGVRHLGSIYEGLLEYRLAQATAPMVVVRSDGKDMWAPAEQAKGDDGERCEAGELYLVTDKGERKATGSYYTPQFIVEYIVENTLGPLVDRCQSPEDILDIKVLDPAMGSGHFLVEATDFLAHRLLEKGASVGRYASGLYGVARYGDAGHEEEADLPALKRLVVERCIYGVDLNPLAVELAKLSLWLDTVAKGQPLSFLDHHLRCGNSLIGAWWRAAAGGEPPNPEGRRRRATTEGTGALFDVQALVHDRQGVVERLAQITAHASDSREAVKAKGAVLAALEEQIAEHLGPLYDLWVSAYFGNPMSAVEWGEARMLLRGEMPLDPEKARELVARAKEIADEWRFFHWELAFPEVFFDAEGRDRPDGGFSAVVGNPPWERTDFEEVPFFTLRRPEIALAPTGAKRKSMIADLEQSAPALWREYQAARANVEAQRLWFKASGHFPLTGSGRPNYYALFAELSCRLLSRQGLAGMIVPSGIATDMTTADLFADLVDTNTLQALLDFENKAGLFADVHREQKFSILILTGGAPRETIEAGFFLHTPEDLTDPERVFPLRPEDCVLMNPNTRTCPIFRTRRDAALTRAIYERVPVLVRETEEGKENPWGASFKQGLFNMTSDSGLFRTAEELDAERFYPVAGKRWSNGQEVCLPLYEGKMIWHFDHRYANALDSDELRKSAQASEAITFEQKSDPGFSASPRYWVSANEMAHAFAGTHPTWFLGFRDIANPNNARTFIVAGIPGTAVGHTLPLLLPSDDSPSYGLLLGNLCAFVLDYVVRRKVGSRHVSFFIVEQLPVLPPARYEEDFGGVRLADFVAERVLELTYTAHDMAGFAHDMGYVDETGKVKAPFPWDEEHRLHLRCQLDALYFHLYGLTREEAEYVLETFPIVKRHDLERFGKYRTKELIGHYYNAYAAGDMAAWVEG
ncbi:MAG: N-6 DNA methylase, partial [Acidobacteriota bacterium]|nr:N-6 DNA methylase [Acidobacteriota bacterium]